MASTQVANSRTLLSDLVCMSACYPLFGSTCCLHIQRRNEVSSFMYVGPQGLVPTAPLEEVLGLGPNRANRSSEQDNVIEMLRGHNSKSISTIKYCNILSIYGSTALCWTLPPFSFSLSFTVNRTPGMGDQPVTRPLPAQRTAQTQSKRTQTTMPQVGLEPTIPVFEWAKTVHAIYGASTVIGIVTH
jgi:hypothetical protein